MWAQRLMLTWDKVLRFFGLSRASMTRHYCSSYAMVTRAHENSVAERAELMKQLRDLRAQLVNVRVAQAERPRMGWEIMAYIPEEALKEIEKGDVDLLQSSRLIADALVNLALQGIINVDKMGKCNALIFSPLNINGPAEASKWVVGLFENNGRFSVSEKAKVRLQALGGTGLYRELKDYEPKQ